MGSPAKSAELGGSSEVDFRKSKRCMEEAVCMGDTNVPLSPVPEDHVQGRKAAGHIGGDINGVEREIVGPEDHLSNGESPLLDHSSNGDSLVLEPTPCSPRPSYITLRPKNNPHKIRARKESIPDLNEGAVDPLSSDPFGDFEYSGGEARGGFGSPQFRRGGEKDARVWSKSWHRC
ncbi:hypothetical protein Hanom_Chr15g01397191 [Helianthus anomalus]